MKALFLRGGNKLTERQINSRRVFFRFFGMEIIVPFPPSATNRENSTLDRGWIGQWLKKR